MRHFKGAALAAIAGLSMILPVQAGAVLTANGSCTMNETAQVSVSFSGMDKDVSVVKSKLDAKIEEIKTLAADQHFTKFDVQSNNYSINGNYNGGYGSDMQFQYSGNASFSIAPADKAVEFMVMLTKKGYQASVNVNSYNSGNCSQTLMK